MRAILLLAVACCFADATAAEVGQYPARPVRMIVPYAPGGGADTLGRYIGQALGESFGQSFVIDNRGGGGTILGSDLAARAPPDGYTIIMVASTHAVVSSLYKSLPFDPIRDFAPIVRVASAPNILVVHPALAVTSVKELVALAKSRPGEITYASSGAGTSQHLGGALLANRAGVDLSHVPYKDAAVAMSDVIGGRVTMFFGNTLFAMPQVRAGKVRAIAVSSLQRIPVVAELPTVAESGYPGFSAVAWFGLLAPSGTPAAVLTKLQQDAARVIAMPDVRSKYTENGGIVVGNTAAEFAAQIKAEILAKGNLVRASGAKVN